MRSALREVLADGLRRMLGREATQARKAAKDPATFLEWLDTFYATPATLDSYVRTAVGACEAAGYQFDALLGDHVERSRDDLLRVAGDSTAETLATNVDQLVETWQHDRPQQTAYDLI